jgi:hypothetical protein
MEHSGTSRLTRVVATLMLAATTVLAASPALGQSGGGGGGGGGGTGDVYADLVIEWRDVDGVPLLAEFTVEGETGPTTEYCVQPVSYVPLPGLGDEHLVINGADGREAYRIPLIGERAVPPSAEDEVEVCDPEPAYAMYVEEAELERLNMARQPDEVRDRKLHEVYLRLLAADEVTLDAAGRITTDGTPIDAAPDHAAIYDSIMRTGAVPGIDAVPAALGGFDAWMLAAAAVGTATGKSVPLTVDAIEYYNRILAIADDHQPAPAWTLDFLETTPPNGEHFVDFRAFSYTRSDVFQGCATWLDVPSLTWKVSPIAEVVDFAELPPVAQDTDSDGVPDTVTNVAGFAQMADDVRAVISYLHENDVIAGFFLDPVFENTCAQQTSALTNPAVAWSGVPDDVIQTATFPVIASVYMPWAATPVDAGQLRISIDALDDGQAFIDAGQVTMVATSGPWVGASVDFTVQDGRLVGTFGPPAGAVLNPGDRLETTFDTDMAAGGPTGAFQLDVELIDLEAAGATLASDVETTNVLAAGPLALWTSVPKIVTQGAYAAASARVFNPDLGGEVGGQLPVSAATLRITLDAPEPFASAADASAWSDAVPMAFSLDGAGDLVGQWSLADPLPVPYDDIVTWHLLLSETSPLGYYALRLELVDSAGVLSTDLGETIVLVATTHGEQPVAPNAHIDSGPAEATTASSATFTFSADQEDALFECSVDGAAPEACTSPTSYTDLVDGDHTFTLGVESAQGSLAGTAQSWNWNIDTTAGELGAFEPMAPVRLLDTRSSTRVGPGETRVLQVAGTNGVPFDAVGVSLNVTVTQPSAASHLTLHPNGEPRPTASNINFVAGDTIANGATVKLGDDGSIAIFNSSGSVHVIVDIGGWYDRSTIGTGSSLQTAAPTRLLDTRQSGVPVGPGETIQVPVIGGGAAPATATAVALNVTVTRPTAISHLTVFPAGGPRPGTSSLNFDAGETIANGVIVEVGDDGEVSIFNSVGTVHVIVDLDGWFQSPPPDGGATVVTPHRALDTRVAPTGAVGPGETIEVPVTGIGGVPASGATSVIVNVTVVAPTASSHLTVYPTGIDRPTASSINFTSGKTIANQVVVQVGSDGTISVFNKAGTTHVIIDVLGWA